MISRRPSWLAVATFVVLTALTLCQDGIGGRRVVQHGDNVYLACSGTPGKACVWIGTDKNGKSDLIVATDIQTRERYELRGDPQQGNCSLFISNVNDDDTRNLTCKITPHKEGISWELIIGSKPNDPFLVYNGQNIDVTTETAVQVNTEDKAEVVCVVENGVPLPIVVWTDPIYNTTDDGKTVKSVLTLILNEGSPEKLVTCIASHELYEEKKSEISAIVGMQYKTNKVEIDHVDNTADCDANGIPRPTEFKWQYQLPQSDKWEEYGITKNITLKDDGNYQCLAQAFDGDWITSYYITYKNNGGVVEHREEETSNTQQAGMIVGIVIAALVVICIIAGLTLFTFRRRVLCFQGRQQHSPGGPQNVENGGKIQTINSPDGRDKPDVKGDHNENTKQKEIVYAQLNLPQSQGNHSPKSPKEKTEYAQIKFQPKENQV